MSIPGSNTDRVQVAKFESPGKGGTEEDFPAPGEIDPTEDAISARGMYCQVEGGPVDEDVWVARDGDDLKLMDKNTGPHTLTQLASGGSLPSASQVGEVLYSKDGSTFTVELPVTSDYGWLVNNDGIHIIVG